MTDLLNSFKSRVEQVTKDLVKVPSVVGTPGEKDIGDKIYQIFKGINYFHENPQNVWLVKAEGGQYPKNTVFALVEGKEKSPETVILMGHIDTVGVEDFGNLKEFAFDPDTLQQKMREYPLSPEVKKDLESGEWMFGRGAHDMKSGVAAHIAVMEELSKGRNFKGNVIFIGEPDEEDMSAGAMAAIDELLRLKKERGYKYIGLINADYTSPRYPEDDNNYVYIGTVGKLLPSFFIVGKETHVGQSFEGLDANMIAAELTRLFDMNTELCDEADGEIPHPPVSLKQTDRKEKYDVQTPFIAQTYYNFFTHKMSPVDVMEVSKKIGKKAFENVVDRLNKEYKHYCEMAGTPFKKLPWEPMVYSYQEFYNKVYEIHGEKLETRLNQLHDELLKDPGIDLREHSFRIVKEVWRWSEEARAKKPLMVIYFSSAFSPRVYMKGDRPEEKRLMLALEEAVNNVKHITNDKILIKKFYPYISDMSFFAISDDTEEVENLKLNMPGWGKKYSLNTDKIRALNIPMVNIGPHGKDAHKATERVYKKYSFGSVPLLIYETVKDLLRQQHTD